MTAVAPAVHRSRGARAWAVIPALFVALVVILALGTQPGDYDPLSPNNSTPSGARAAAEVLRAEGVAVRQVDALAGARISTPATTTLVIANPGQLTSAQTDSVLAFPGTLVFLGVSEEVLDALDTGLSMTNILVGSVVDASCAEPDAVAAQRVLVQGDVISGAGRGEDALCFTTSGGESAYLAVDRDGARRVVLASATIADNAHLAQEGNAALVLRSLGSREALVWYVATGLDQTLLPAGGQGGPASPVQASPDFLPPGFGNAVYALALAVGVVALWRGRRFGPLVTERLPVVAHASEATRGRGRLYRRARATGRATAALRAASAARMAARLGVPRHATPRELVAALALATGRPDADIDALVYGSAPTTEADMMAIVTGLDTLESEVNRR